VSEADLDELAKIPLVKNDFGASIELFGHLSPFMYDMMEAANYHYNNADLITLATKVQVYPELKKFMTDQLAALGMPDIPPPASSPIETLSSTPSTSTPSSPIMSTTPSLPTLSPMLPLPTLTLGEADGGASASSPIFGRKKRENGSVAPIRTKFIHPVSEIETVFQEDVRKFTKPIEFGGYLLVQPPASGVSAATKPQDKIGTRVTLSGVLAFDINSRELLGQRWFDITKVEGDEARFEEFLRITKEARDTMSYDEKVDYAGAVNDYWQMMLDLTTEGTLTESGPFTHILIPKTLGLMI
jgi:hypothetical protein